SQVASRIGNAREVNKAAAGEQIVHQRASRAGFPYTTADGGTSDTTTEPAPIIAPSPIVIPGRIVEPPPILAPARTRVSSNFMSCCFERGYLSFVKVTFGPTKTSSSNVIPSQS